jgi:hypothetical protein
MSREEGHGQIVQHPDFYSGGISVSNFDPITRLSARYFNKFPFQLLYLKPGILHKIGHDSLL